MNSVTSTISSRLGSDDVSKLSADPPEFSCWKWIGRGLRSSGDSGFSVAMSTVSGTSLLPATSSFSFTSASSTLSSCDSRALTLAKEAAADLACSVSTEMGPVLFLFSRKRRRLSAFLFRVDGLFRFTFTVEDRVWVGESAPLKSREQTKSPDEM